MYSRGQKCHLAHYCFNPSGSIYHPLRLNVFSVLGLGQCRPQGVVASLILPIGGGPGGPSMYQKNHDVAIYLICML